MNVTAIIGTISPLSADANSSSITLTVTGLNFDPTSLVYWNGQSVPTNVINGTNLTATIAPSLFPVAGIYNVQVFTPSTALEVGDSTLSDPVQFIANLSLAEAQAVVSDLIDEHRTNLTQGYFTWNGSPFACDPVSKSNVIGASVMAIANGGNLPAGFVWRDNNNVNHQVTGQQMIQLAAGMFTFLTNCYEAAWIHKANIEAITTSTGDVFAYNYTSTLWPNPNA